MQSSTVGRRTLALTEFEEQPFDLTPQEVQRLRMAAGDRIRLTAGDRPNNWFVRASQYVGTVVTPDLQLLVRPKVPIANVLYLLEEDGNALAVNQREFHYGTDPEIVPAFATLYARRLEDTLATGIVRAYVTEEEQLTAPRGRIDIARQVRTGWRVMPVACRFDEYAVNIPLNRILLAAARRLMRMAGLAPATRRSLLRSIHGLDGVGPLQRSDIERSTRFTRLDERFRATEALARIVLASASVRDEQGSVSAGSFFLDMNAVFERFVSYRLARLVPSPLRVDLQHALALDEDGHVGMRPDIVARDGTSVVAVADAKYKISTDGLGRTPDYYQLLAYTTALALPAGLLIYCQVDNNTPPRRITVRHTGQILETVALRLDGAAHDIDRQMEAVASTFTALAVRPHRALAAA